MVSSLVQGVALGAPNIYRAADEMRRTLGTERMDVCAFVGVTPRGPCRIAQEPEACELDGIYVEADRPQRRSVAVAVNSWDEYRRYYGSFEGPGRLPYAVATFFEQGGQRAYICRIVHEYHSHNNRQALARGELQQLSSSGGLVYLDAKNEGSWGNQLRAALGFTSTPLVLLPSSSVGELRLSSDDIYPIGTLLRLTLPNLGASHNYEFRFVTQQGRKGVDNSEISECYLLLNTAVSDIPIMAEVVEADLLIEDGRGFQERFDRLGLAAGHPRWMAKVLYNQSQLVNPHAAWVDSELTPIQLHAIPLDVRRALIDDPVLFKCGLDRYKDIVHSDFFDDTWVLGNHLPGDGVHALTHIADLASVVVPDLYVPESLPKALEPESEISLVGATFSPCVDAEISVESMGQSIPSLPGLLLNPLVAADLTVIIELQKQIVELAHSLRQFVVLLDVPPGINQQTILSWRFHFRSSFVAAYFPWVTISNSGDGRDSLIVVNPAAVAAGIIARQELTFGVPHGPANVIARGVITVDEKISSLRHDELHPSGINIFLQQRDGVWLSAGRTLSRDPSYRQLSVRRLMTMLQRVLVQQMMWVVFEPNHPSLWYQIRHLLNNFLRQLYRVGAFKGRSEEEAFFVRCDGELNSQRILDAGKLIVEIGVAPAEPLEFIVVRIIRGGDGTLALES